MFRTILPPRPARPTVGGSPRQVFRVILDEEGSIEEVVDLLLDYRPRLIALCSRLDVPTPRTLTEVQGTGARRVD